MQVMPRGRDEPNLSCVGLESVDPLAGVMMIERGLIS